jgi:pyruvate,water dikinase
MNLRVLDLGGGVAPRASGSRVAPEDVTSVPFQAFWRGAADPRVSWTGRRDMSATGFFSVVQNAMFDQASGGTRRLGDPNYLFVAPDYMNLNARLAYHYAMLDAAIGDLAANNYVAFRFVGGGAGRARRDLRARFLADVLTRLGFAVDAHGDLVNAWLRAVPAGVGEDALAHLGRLMACARQLDMLLADENSVRAYVRRFLDEDYGSFG